MVVIVVGMHRSGTSALAGMLHANGILMGDNGDFYPPPQRENPKGFYENRRFRVINDQVLRTAGYHVKTFDPALPHWNGQVGESAWRQMLHLVDYYQAQNSNWGWKDPRTSLTLWHWLRALRSSLGAKANIKVLVTDRDHEDIAQSMRNRGNKERLFVGQFKALAEHYYDHLMNALIKADQPFMRVPFDRLIYDTGGMVKEIEGYLGYGIPDTSFIDPAISRTVDPPEKVKREA